jgi:hypothetical protein
VGVVVKQQQVALAVGHASEQPVDVEGRKFHGSVSGRTS